MKTMNMTRRKAKGETTRPYRLTLRTPHSAFRNRKGVLLLVILGMLTLFLMIGTAFIMSGNQYRRANKTYSKVGEQKNLQASQDSFLTEVINQIIRDTANQNSSLRFHSLLRDLYGMEGLVATIPTAAPLPTWGGDISGTTNNFTDGQMVEFQIPVANFRDYFGNLLATGRLSQVENFYTGQIITFLDGPAKGRSTRIVGYFRRQAGSSPPSPADPAVIRVLNVTLDNALQITDPTVLAGSRILINGRPFNGTGVGYNPLAAAGAAKLNAAEQIPGLPDQATLPTPIALMPNAPFFIPVPGTNVAPEYFSSQWATLTNAQRQALLNNMGYEGQGGSDESYDAPDFQNMFLAWTSTNPVETIFQNFDATTDIRNNTTPPPTNPLPDWTRTNLPPFLGNIVLPSFHRPDLINYWAQQTISGGELALGRTDLLPLLRKVMLRPNWHDHPDFDGSNPEFAKAKADAKALSTPDQLLRMIYGPWDVDNDMDGIRDSVWVDFGAPVMVGSKGRLVKPLAAIMVLDMDGRLNVNAHGTREIAKLGGGLEQAPPSNPASGTTWDSIPRGQAFGVAEIDLSPLINSNTFQRLLNGDARDVTNDGTDDLFIAGRYGLPGTGDNEPGFDDTFDLSAQLKMQGFPLNLPERSNFGSLPDLRTRYKSALNDFGQFVTTWTPADSNAHSLVEDNPYELDLSTTGARGQGTSVDNPFSPAELERLLRVYDLDAGTLAPRLYELLKGNQTNADLNDINRWRTMLTTDSYDLPEPSFQMPAWVRLGIDGVLGTPDDYETVMGTAPINGTFVDLMEYRFRLAQPDGIWFKSADTATRIDGIRKQLRRVIAPEMLAGLRFDLNRPFGNGRDDNENGVVDEPGEYLDANGNGRFDAGEGDIYWRIDATNLSPNDAKDAFEDSQFGKTRFDYDYNGDGMIDAVERANSNPTDLIGLVNLHNYQRQLYARQLYMMALALIDPIPPLDLSSVPVTPTTLRKEKIKLHRETLEEQSRKLAQWAINVVDFRDPDNIMTAFEYDAIPFNGWQVDGDIRTTTDLPNWSDDGVDNNNNGLVDRDDPEELAFRNRGLQDGTGDTDGDDDGDGLIDNDDPDEIAERQVVWGMERPEVLMTETLAWHDRATEDLGTGVEDAVTDENADQKIDEDDEGKVGLGGDAINDKDFDQHAKPQGAAFIELYNPSGQSPGASADTHLLDEYGNDLGVDLAAVSIPNTDPSGPNRTSPVWRINVRKSVDYTIRNGEPHQLSRYAGGPDHDPDDPDQRVQPQVPDRTIYFTPFDPEQHFELRTRTKFPRGESIPKWETTWDDDGVAFFSSLTNPTAAVNGNDLSYIQNHAVVRPGRYMVVGSGIPVDSQGDPVEPSLSSAPLPSAVPARNPNIARYETWVGNKKRTSAVKRHAVVLNPFATGAQSSVMVRNSTPDPGPDTALRDQANFDVSATAENTSVAIIDSTWFRNIDRAASPPSVRAQGWEYRPFSVSEPATGYPLATFNSFWSGKYYNDPNGQYRPALDIPLDNQRWHKTSYPSGNIVDSQSIVGLSGPQLRWMRKSGPSDSTATFELIKDNELRLTLPEKEETSVRTIPGFSWLYLQRLANPLIPWNPLPGDPKHRPNEIVNPYMTVDSMGVNVTVFNGRDIVEKRRFDALDGVTTRLVRDYSNADAIRAFASLQRGRMNVDDIELLRARLRDTQGFVGEPGASDGVPERVQDSGFRNLPKGTAFAPGTPTNPAFIRDPHVGGAQPFAYVPGNLWGEEQVGKVDSGREDMSSVLKKPVGLWLNKSGPIGDGLYRAAVTGSHYFHSLPDCTLGFMNEPFREANPLPGNQLRNSMGPELYDRYVPAQPFPWFTWNNRPFANAGELMQVPAFRSSQALKVSGMSKSAVVPDAGDPKGLYVEKYRGHIRRGSYPVPSELLNTFRTDPGRLDFNVAFPPLAADGPFGHLPNYFRSLQNHHLLSLKESDYKANGSKKPNPKPYHQGFAGMHRMFDLVTVPSLYVGGETWLNPTTFGDTATPIASTADPRYGLQPPFNKISSRREPGRVNINTIPGANEMRIDRPSDDTGDPAFANLWYRRRFASPIWNGLYHSIDVANRNGKDDNNNDGTLDDFSHAAAEYRSVIGSRRGYGPHFPEVPNANPNFADYFSTSQPTYLHAAYPTIFANPFRHGDSGFLVPLNNMVLLGVDCTLHRHDHPIKGNDGEWGVAGKDDGNGIDDDNNGQIDDASEIGIDPILNGVIDDLAEHGYGQQSPGVRSDDAIAPLHGATTSANTDTNLMTVEDRSALYRDAPRNPYYRYSPISRLSSMTTNRSNVFAIWVTIGFFEVREISETEDGGPDGILSHFGTGAGTMADATADPLFQRVYPDGYTFGKEAGIETGEVERVREFAIVDRTIPVAFEPGANHNVGEMIRLRRKIKTE